MKLSDLKVRLKEHRRKLAKFERWLKRSERDEKKSQDAKIKEQENERQMNIVIELAYTTGHIEVLSRFLKGMRQSIPTNLETN
ncbi:MAG: hypothetical protein Q7T80_01275 [Methanoregula sp.]|nr:hypothetical protein [Methanoregula sp.]